MPSATHDQFVIHDPGPLTTVQDLGRPGYAALGVPPSGAADPVALRLANRLAGNREDTACLELTFGGLTGEFTRGRYFALTGADVDAHLDATAIAVNAPYYARPGQTLRIGRPRNHGIRSYLAVSGGFTVPMVLGSRSTDTMSGLGPDPLRAGQRLRLGPPTGTWPAVELAPVAAFPASPVLEIIAGPRDDWFTAEAMLRLTREPYLVTTQANRVGIRLDGPHLARRLTGELPSEGMVSGALQVPSSGQPILLLTEHPTTGGYPVIAVVTTPCLPLAGQLAPGDTVRFRLPATESTS